MKEFKDRQPGSPGRYQIQPEGPISTSGNPFTAILKLSDIPSEEGTRLTREVFMDLQGFFSGDTTVSDNIITTTFKDGGTLVSTVEDNIIQSTYTGPGGTKISRRTTVNQNTISTVSEEVL